MDEWQRSTVDLFIYLECTQRCSRKRSGNGDWYNENARVTDVAEVIPWYLQQAMHAIAHAHESRGSMVTQRKITVYIWFGVVQYLPSTKMSVHVWQRRTAASFAFFYTAPVDLFAITRLQRCSTRVIYIHNLRRRSAKRRP